MTELLAWTDAPIASLVAGQDPSAVSAHVSWAGPDPVPVWLDHGRELAERWIHRQQLLAAIGEASDLRADLAVPVLDTLRWAYPYRLGACRRPVGSVVVITVSGPGLDDVWRLRSDGSEWDFDADDGEVVARIDLTTEQAWRLLTNNYVPDAHGPIDASGDLEVVDVLRRTRAIIGTPQ